MRIFGITGGSGSGKTSVSDILKELGVKIIDTDTAARAVVAKGSDCLKELTAYFGSSILNGDGTLNRKKLADTAFSDTEKTAALNRITHKYIKEEVIRAINSSSAPLIGIDGAVIIGSGIDDLCEFIVSVTADRDTRIKRIKERDAITDAQAAARLDAQPSDDFYISHSLYVIDNSAGRDALRKQVRKMYDKIKEV